MARKPALRHRPTKPESGDLRDYLHLVMKMGHVKRPTAENIARALDLSQNRAQTLIKDGLTPEDVLTLAEHYRLNPVLTLVDFGFLTMDQIYDAVTKGNVQEEKPKALRTPYEISGERLYEILEKYGDQNLTFTLNLGEEEK